MKRFTLLIMAVLIMLTPLSSFAQTSSGNVASDYVSLGELRIQALNGWHETYHANGREVVANVDINWMPEADVCPVLEIEPISGLAIQEKGRGMGLNIKPYYEDATFGANIQCIEEDINNPNSAYRGTIIWKQNIVFFDGKTPTEIPEGLALSYSGFLGFINELFIKLLGIGLDDFHIDEVTVQGREYTVAKKDGQHVFGEPLTRCGTYSIILQQTFQQIPMLNTFLITPGGKGWFVYADNQYYCGQLSCSLQKDILLPDVPLLSFSAMLRALEKQIEYGNLRGVDEMEFGYLPFYQGEKSERTWVLLPVWRIKGGYTNDANTTKEVLPYRSKKDEDGSLTVPQEYGDYYYNAQTGEQLPATAWRDGTQPLPAWNILTWDDLIQPLV